MPTIVLLHSKKRWRSSFGTPSISTITCNGSSAATSVTKSHVPRDATASTIRRARSRTCCSVRLSILGENPRFTRRRYFVWRGGSMLSMSSRCGTSCSSGYGGRRALPRADENVFWSSDTRHTSAWRVTAQKPPPWTASGCQYTGASARRRRNVSCGTPATKLSGFERSAPKVGDGATACMGPSLAKRAFVCQARRA